MKNTLEKLNKLADLKTQVELVKKDLSDNEILSFVKESFSEKGFVEDPRGVHYSERGLYNPEMKVSVWIYGLNETTIGISVHPMKNNGLEWDNDVIHLTTGNEVNWNFKDTFDKYFNSKFIKRINKMKGIQ